MKSATPTDEEHKKTATYSTNFPVVEKDGHTLVDPYHDKPEIAGKYLVRYYAVPETPSLDFYYNGVRDFEKRFLNFVDRGYNIAKVKKETLNRYIEKEQSVLDNPKISEGERELATRWICTAKTARMAKAAREHLHLRIEEGEKADPTKLKQLEQQINDDYLAVIMSPLRPLRKGGGIDIDDTTGEMMGEPYKMFTASLTNNADMVKQFFDARYVKTAQTMRSIDNACDAISGITARYKEYKKPVQEMAAAAKDKVQLQHSDPDYQAADRRFMIARNHLRNMIAQERLVLEKEADEGKSLTRKAPRINALDRLDEATSLMYDLTITHYPRDKSVKSLAIKVIANGFEPIKEKEQETIRGR